jgi:hypothetical protein
MASGDPQNTSQPEKNGDGSKSQSKEKMTDKEQSERFIETARELGIDENGKAFDKTIASLFSHQKK